MPLAFLTLGAIMGGLLGAAAMYLYMRPDEPRLTDIYDLPIQEYSIQEFYFEGEGRIGNKKLRRTVMLSLLHGSKTYLVCVEEGSCPELDQLMPSLIVTRKGGEIVRVPLDKLV